MADPITGLDTEDRTQDVLDYLGRRSPLSFSGQAALPNVGPPGPSGGPSGPSGLGSTPAGEMAGPLGSSDPSAGGTGALEAAAGSGGGSDSSALILNLIRQGIGGGQTALGTAKTITGAEGSPESMQARGDLFSGVEPSGPASTELPSFEGFSAPAGVFTGVEPQGPVSTEASGSGGFLDIAGAGLSGAGLATLIAQLAESGKITPKQAAGLLQSSGGLASSGASILGPAEAGGGTALSGTLGAGAAGLLGTAGSIVGGAGAIGSIGLTLKDAFDAIHNAEQDPRQYATAGGAAVGLGAGALLGTAVGGPYGALIGAGAGGAAGDYIGQVIARNLPPTHYNALRSHWGEVAADAVNSYGFGIQKAANEGSITDVMSAMSQRYADGHVGAYLKMPDYLAQAIGVPAMTPFDSLTPEQFGVFLKAASQADPEQYKQWIGAQGDVQFLEQDRAQGVAEATQGTALATIKAMIDLYQPILAQMPDVAGEQIAAERQWIAGQPTRDLETRGIAPDAYAESLRLAGM